MTREAEPASSTGLQAFLYRDVTRPRPTSGSWFSLIAIWVVGLAGLLGMVLMADPNPGDNEPIGAMVGCFGIIALCGAVGMTIDMAVRALRSRPTGLVIDPDRNQITFTRAWLADHEGRFNLALSKRSYPLESVTVLTSRTRFDLGAGIMFATPDGTVLTRPLEDPEEFAKIVAIPSDERGSYTFVCPSCDYSLVGNTSGRCPECGAVILGATPSAVVSPPVLPDASPSPSPSPTEPPSPPSSAP